MGGGGGQFTSLTPAGPLSCASASQLSFDVYHRLVVPTPVSLVVVVGVGFVIHRLCAVHAVLYMNVILLMNALLNVVVSSKENRATNSY